VIKQIMPDIFINDAEFPAILIPFSSIIALEIIRIWKRIRAKKLIWAI